VKFTSRKMSWRAAVGAALSVAVAASLVGCSTGSGSQSGSGGTSGNKTIVAFLPPASDPYVANWLKAGTAEAKKSGYSIRVITENSASATTTQVQQVLGGGSLPSLFVWWPVDPASQVGTLAQLHASKVPVFQVNQLPVAGSEKYITAYAGVSDTEIGKVAGEAAIEARDALRKSGAIPASAGGTAIVPNLPVGYGATVNRLAGFKEAIKGSGITVVDVGNATGFAAQDAFTLTSQMVAADRSKNFNLVYAPEDDFAVGAIRALSQAGYSVGKNVQVIGGSCHGDESQVANGKQFNTIIQGAGLEGQFAVNRMVQYLKNPKVSGGTYIAPSTAGAVPTFPSTVSALNIIPTPVVQSQDYSSAKLWGTPVTQWCTY
jgi:ABC-type sugar transport system substrate-binding protein